MEKTLFKVEERYYKILQKKKKAEQKVSYLDALRKKYAVKLFELKHT